jgi:hypothetical protein
VLGDKKLQSAGDQKLLFESSDERVGLYISGRDDHGNAVTILFERGGSQSSDDAFDAGRLWRHLSVAFPRAEMAADFDPPPLPSRNSDDRPDAAEVPGLIVYPVKSGLTARVESWGVLAGQTDVIPQ